MARFEQEQMARFEQDLPGKRAAGAVAAIADAIGIDVTDSVRETLDMMAQLPAGGSALVSRDALLAAEEVVSEVYLYEYENDIDPIDEDRPTTKDNIAEFGTTLIFAARRATTDAV